MITKHEDNVESLELQIIKLTFYIVSFIAIINFSLIETSSTSPEAEKLFEFPLKMVIDVRSVLVLVITSWIDCLELGQKSHYYLGPISDFQERRSKRNAYGGILGIILVPICFLLMFMSASGIDIAVATQLVMASSLFFVGIKVVEIVEIFNLKYKKKVGNKV